MAQRDQIGGAFGRHDARQPRHRQNIALFRPPFDHQCQGGGPHHHRTLRHCAARRGRFARHIDHMRPALIVEMGQHHKPAACKGRARMARVAASTSACRIRLSPIRKFRAP